MSPSSAVILRAPSAAYGGAGKSQAQVARLPARAAREAGQAELCRERGRHDAAGAEAILQAVVLDEQILQRADLTLQYCTFRVDRGSGLGDTSRATPPGTT